MTKTHDDKRAETHACDLISRQTALEALNRIEISRNASWYEFYQKALTAVGILPSAQPERKKGHWIEINDSYNRISGKCSVCGWESHMYEDDVVGMDFCPNCGARLDGEQHD